MQQENLAGVLASLNAPTPTLNISNISLINLLRDAFFAQSTLRYVQNNIHQQDSELSPRKRKTQDGPVHHFTDHWGIQNMSLVQLKQICKGLNLSVTGRKSDLVRRIVHGKKTQKGHSKRYKRLSPSDGNTSESDSEMMMTEVENSQSFSTCTILSIPLELQSLILSFLPTMDLLATVPLVCSSWNGLVTNKGHYSVWKFIRSINLSEIPRLSSYKLQKVLSLGGYRSSTSSTFTHHQQPPFTNDNNNNNKPSLLHNVTSISLREVDDEALLELAAACPMLEYLEMSVGLLNGRPTFAFPNISHLSLTFIPMGFQPGKLLPSLEHCVKLTHLKVKDNSGCPFRWVTSVLQKSTLCPLLETIELIDWQPDDYFNTERWSNLQHLKFSSTPGSTRRALPVAFFDSAKTPELATIEIRDCSVQASLFDCFVKVNPKLESLVCKDVQITDYNRWENPESNSHAPAELVFENCNISPELLASLTSQVKRISLAHSHVNEAMLEVLQNCSSLLELDLRDSTGLKSLQPLANMTKLQSIALPVTLLRKKNALDLFLSSNPQLKKVQFVSQNTNSQSSSSPVHSYSPRMDSISRNLQNLRDQYPSVQLDAPFFANLANQSSS